jgi:hypothetical protein
VSLTLGQGFSGRVLGLITAGFDVNGCRVCHCVTSVLQQDTFYEKMRLREHAVYAFVHQLATISINISSP